MAERTAIYPGSFDPPTKGHLDLIERAHAMFDRLIVAVAYNPEKSGLFSPEDRIAMLREMTHHIDGVEIDAFQGLTVEFARKTNAVALIRGLRVVSDFEYELTMAINNHKLNPDVDTVCLMPSEPYLFLSSRMVREIASFGGKVDHYVTAGVERRLREKFGH